MARPKPTTTARGEASRERLLAAARDLLVAAPERFELAPLTKAAGVSTGAVYHHFASKGALLAAVVDDFYDRLDARVWDAEITGGSWAEREYERTRRLVEFHLTDPVAPALLRMLVAEPELAAVDARRAERLGAAAARNLARGVESGDLSADLDCGLAGALVVGGLRQALGYALEERRSVAVDELAERLWRLISPGIGIASSAHDSAGPSG